MKRAYGIIGVVVAVTAGYALSMLWAMACVYIQLKVEMHYTYADVTLEPVISCIRNLFWAVETIPLAIIAGFIFLHVRYSRFWEIVFWFGTALFTISGVFRGIGSLPLSNAATYVPIDASRVYLYAKVGFVALVTISQSVLWAYLFGVGALGWKYATRSATIVRVKKTEWMAFLLSVLLLFAIIFFFLLLLDPRLHGFWYS